MINLFTIALYYGDPLGPIKGIISVIIFIAVIGYCCKTTDSTNNKNTGTNTTYRHNTYTPRYDIEDENEYTNYDPTWDDAFFEKYGGEPWIDDNPWDHEKK